MKKAAAVLTNLVLGLAALAVTALAAEGCLRLAGFEAPRYVTPDDYRQAAKLHQPHQKARWCGQLGSVMDFDNPVETNALALHDSDHAVEKPADIYRILILGDSYVEAFQVPLQDTFFKRLESQLNTVSGRRLSGGKKIEVIAIGQSGWGAIRAKEALQRLGLQYRPDLVVAELLIENDFRDDLFLAKESEQPSREGPRAKLERQLSEAAKRDELFGEYNRLILFKNSRLNRALAFWWTQISRKSDNDRAQRQLYEKDLAIYENKTLHPMFDASRIEWRRAIELTLATHLRMRQMAEAAGARYMVFLPDCRLANSAEGQRNVERLFPTLLGRLDYRRPLKIAGKYFTANNVAHLDMTPGFERAAASGKGTLHFEHDGHWNPAGHRLAARLLEEYLLSDPTRVGLSGDGS